MKLLIKAVVILSVLAVNTAHADRTTYADGSRPQILINWESFEDAGFPSEWKVPVTNLVINGYTRINRVAGVDVRPQFRNFITGRTDSNPGEIVISANEAHNTSTRLASTFGPYPDRLNIVFHRNSGATMTPWNFTPFFPQPGEISMYGVFMHELMHSLGIDHNIQSERTIMRSNLGASAHFGPWDYDVNSLRALYPLRDSDRLRMMVSSDGGSTFSSRNTTVQTLDRSRSSTTHAPAIAADQDEPGYMLSWTRPNKRLSYLRTDGNNVESWYTFGGGPDATFGSSMAAGDNDTWLWAFTRIKDDKRELKVLRSSDDGINWGYVVAPDVETYARPGLARTRAGGVEAWVLTWSDYNANRPQDSGRIMASISTNDGESWSPAEAISDFYRAHDGVTVDCDGAGNCLFGFVWGGSMSFEYGQNRVRYMRARVDATNRKLSSKNFCYPNESSRVAPGVAHDSTGNQFIAGVRNQNYRTTLGTMKAAVGSCPGTKSNIQNSDSHVAPDMAGNNRYGEMTLWYAKD